MSQRNVLILERSSQNLQKISSKGKTVLEGVFAEFGIENRNGRVYEEKEYLPHLEYLKKDIAKGNLLGELDHPERFEVSLGNVSHRVTELWYDQGLRQIKGRLEVLDTPKGQIAKALLDAGVPLSISSRAAGTVNEDKTVQIQQIYTYDLVAKPGFESAELSTVNEGLKSKIQSQIQRLNESYNKYEEQNISAKLGIVNENISIIDLTDKYPSVKIREEAEAINIKNKNKNENNQMEDLKQFNEEALQKWTLYAKNEFSKLNERLSVIESAILGGSSPESIATELSTIKKYVEKLRGIQEGALNWQGDIAKAVNKVASYADSLAEKNNEHYSLTKKIVETVDHNAKTLNHTQDWIGNNAEVQNAMAETVDHNAEMLNEINEWNEEMAPAINELYTWGVEKAKSINAIHEWVSSVAKGVNETANWSEDMFGRAMSKEDAKKLIEYIELVSESKKDPELKKKLNEILSLHGITGKPLSESMIKGLSVITDVKKTGNVKVATETKKNTSVNFDGKIITAKDGSKKLVKSSKPSELKTITTKDAKSTKLTSSPKVKGIMVIDTVKGKSRPIVKISGSGPTSKMKASQNLKLNTKPEGKLKEEFNRASVIKTRSTELSEKLNQIIVNLEKEKKLDEELRSKFPFLNILGEKDRKDFAGLSLTDKQKVNQEVIKAPTTDADLIKSIWENALINRKVKNEEPLWLSAAPKKYRDEYDKANNSLKEYVKARSEFYPLETQYQINDFWENTGLVEAQYTSLNEVLLASTPKESDQKWDSFVSGVGEQMKRYSR